MELITIGGAVVLITICWWGIHDAITDILAALSPEEGSTSPMQKHNYSALSARVISSTTAWRAGLSQ
jgi:hypothetical protein